MAKLSAARKQLQGLTLTFHDGVVATLHKTFLRDNCPKHRHPTSNQKLVSPANIPLDLDVDKLKVHEDHLTVTWSPDSHESKYPTTWLREVSETLVPDKAHERRLGDIKVPQVEWEKARGDDAVMRWVVESIGDKGAVLFSDVPQVQGMVAQVARLIGPLQPNIYGDVFDVVTTPVPINIAYSSHALPPHMDLCYYESPPGLQLLHCLSFDDETQGGESFLIDGFGVANTLRDSAPDAFEVLSRVPATFVKDHSQRDLPVLMSYSRPHITLCPQGRVVGFFWSPPFEGPLRVSQSDAAMYYDAYRTIDEHINRAPRWNHRLCPGELLIFNNRRMLHGRSEIFPPRTEASATDSKSRWLQGCYINIDEFANRYNIDLRDSKVQGEASKCSLGNQDWGSGPVVLCKYP